MVFLNNTAIAASTKWSREHVDVIIGKMSDKPGAGIILLKRIRTLIGYAMALGWTDRDPTE